MDGDSETLMRLWQKYSLLIGLCVVGSVGVTAEVLAHFFAADTEAYLSDLQSSTALQVERELRLKSGVLYSQLAGALATGTPHGDDWLSKIPGVLHANSALHSPQEKEGNFDAYHGT